MQTLLSNEISLVHNRLIIFIIMNYLREKVSGNKNRMKEQNYNLDLTYICPRILAMSFPGEGLEKAYRNDINEVS